MMSDKEDPDHSDTTQSTESQLLNVSAQRSTKRHKGGRVRLFSESEVSSQVSRWDDTEFQDGVAPMEGRGGDGAPFRGRSQSAPAALWAAKKYGRQLRRMSDEFDTWLDRGELKKGISPGTDKQKKVSRGWFSFPWGTKEEEGRE